MMPLELSVIIVNYNGKRFLKDCLESLSKHLGGVSYEVVIVDNASPDQSAHYIEQEFPMVKLLKSDQNLGFGRGNNAGVAIASGEYILLINNDTIVLDNLKPALDKLRQDKTIGAIGINMLDEDQKYLVPGGNFPNFSNMFQLKKLIEMGPDFASGNFSKPEYDVDWLGGAFLMMPKSLYQQIGGFDPDYFMYVEDVDLGKRLQALGYRRVFLPALRYIHFVGFNKSRNPLLVKGYETFISKHHKGLDKQKLKFAITANKLVKYIKSRLGLG